jgi:thymidylate synthase (FAD)
MAPELGKTHADEITVVTHSKVQLIAAQEFRLPAGFEGWETDAPSDAERLTEFAGRLCYLSFGDVDLGGGHKTIKGRPGGNLAYTNNILSTKHGSVLEHAQFSVLIEGVSRSLTHELVRHRAGFAFSQLSQRYVDESNIAFVLPPEIKQDTPEYESWRLTCALSLQGYRALLSNPMHKLEAEEGTKTMKLKRARQAARSVLPNAAETKIVVTGNGRAWRHFIEMRASVHADMEIRALGVAVYRLLAAEAPHLFGGMGLAQLPDGTFVVESVYTKV